MRLVVGRVLCRVVIPFNADNKAHDVECPDWCSILN